MSAQAAYRARRFAEASDFCRQILLSDGRNSDAKTLLANCLSAAGQPANAEALFREVLQSTPQHFEAMLALSTLIASRGANEEATQILSRATLLRPTDPMANYRIGFVYLGIGWNQEAADRFTQAAKLSSNVAEFQHFSGVALQRLGKTKEAASHYRAAISLNPSAVLTHFELGHLMLTVGDPASAITSIQKVVELDPKTPKGHFLLARALAEMHRFEEAEVSISRALDLDPKFAQAFVLRGRLLQQHGRFKEGEANLRRAISLHPDCADGYLAIVNARVVNEEDRPLVSQIEKLVESGTLGPHDLRPLQYALGKSHEDLGDYETAMSHFHEANRLSQARLVSLGRIFDPEKLRNQVDETCRRLTPEALATFNGLGSSSGKPLFIVGMARSGTTLLEQIVSSHPKVAGAGELGTWSDMEIFQGSALPTAKQMQDVANRFLDKLESYSRDSERVTVKTPQNYFMLGQILAVFPNCRILHCQRSPIDTCLSIYTTAFFSGPDFAHELTSLVKAYREYLRVMDHWRRILPNDRFLDVSYESLVSDRVTVLKEVVAFLDLEWNDSLLHHEKNDHAISTPSLWQARQPVFTRSVERWRKYEPWLGPLGELLKYENVLGS
jgi:tetratricopeptide (TPR) repeat protein